MGFFDTLSRVLGGNKGPQYTSREIEAIHLGMDPDELPIAPEEPFEAGHFDRTQWAKKVKRVLERLPESQKEWSTVLAESKAMDFDPAWVQQCIVEEFTMLVRRFVADRVVTETEHRKLDFARDLLGIRDAEAEAILHQVVADAETFFGKQVEGA